MKEQKLNVIVCPHCGTEYLPSEIYIGKAFIGDARDVGKDCQGRIIDYVGSTMDTKEQYICDKCNRTFYITANVKFNTSLDNPYGQKEYKTPLKTQKLNFIEA